MEPKYNIDTTWESGNLATQLVNKYNINPITAERVSQEYGNSGTTGLNKYLSKNGITLQENGLGKYGGGWSTPEYGKVYNDNGTIKMSDIGTDQAMDMTQFNNWAETHPDEAQQIGMQGLIFGENGQQVGSNGKPLDDGSWGYKQWGTAASAGLGLGQLGLGVAQYLTARKTAEKQNRLLDQQYANNADLIATRKAHNAAMNKGLAAGASILA